MRKITAREAAATTSFTTNDNNTSLVSMTSRPSLEITATNKPLRWLSIRRLLQDIHGQRLKSSKKKLKTENDFKSITNHSKKNKDSNKLSSVVSPVSSNMPTSNSFLECPICLTNQTLNNFYQFKATLCFHRICKECLKKYLKVEITESRVNIACPVCPENFHPNDIKSLLIEDLKLFEKYEQFMIRRVLMTEPDARWCPAPDCNFVVLATGCASCPKLSCARPGCGATFCYHCKQIWHPNQTCDAAKAERSFSVAPNSGNSHNLVTAMLEVTGVSSSSALTGQNLHSLNEIKPCPRCEAFIIKMDDGSCNHMTCPICGAEFCWLCMKEISDLHYLSPSGCTFWGKKPWSRKKKILWQLGTLVGAPVGITLIAGLAVPAIMIGLPVWVGRRIFSKCSHMTSHKRNLAITGGVISSILISPLLAAMAVGIGVPVLLAYVYGVVPISLCRSGGCGMKPSENERVKIEFDDTSKQTNPISLNHYPVSQSETRSVVEGMTGTVANPSIGPSIGEMSLVMTNSLSASGSHLDRVGGVIREDSCDRDSASQKAMSGSCMAENISNNPHHNPPFQNRLEVQAEMTPISRPATRTSLSNDLNNYNLDTKSVTVSFGESIVFIDNIQTNNSSIQAANSSIKHFREPIIENFESSQNKNSDSNSDSFQPMASSLKSPFQRYGSPPAMRSVSFKNVEGSIENNTTLNLPVNCAIKRGRSQYNKKQSISLGDSIDEEHVITLDNSSYSHCFSEKQFCGENEEIKQTSLDCYKGASNLATISIEENIQPSSSSFLTKQHSFVGLNNLKELGNAENKLKDSGNVLSSSSTLSSCFNNANNCSCVSIDMEINKKFHKLNGVPVLSKHKNRLTDQTRLNVTFNKKDEVKETSDSRDAYITTKSSFSPSSSLSCVSIK